PTASGLYVPITTTVKLYDGETLINTLTAYYGSVFTLGKNDSTNTITSGWYDNADLTGINYLGSNVWTEKASEISLYADRETYDYRVSLVCNFGFTDKEYVLYNTGDTTKYPIPANTSKVFMGWYLDSACTISAGEGLSGTETGNFNIYSKWEIASDTYVNLFCPEDDDTYCGTIYFENGTNTKLPKVNYNGYRFIGWYTEQEDGEQIADANGNIISLNFDSGDTLYARMLGYNLTYELDGGTNSVNNPTIYDYYPMVVTFEPATKAGYRFMGWQTENGNYITSVDWTLKDDVMLFAQFERIYTLTFDSKGGTAVNDMEVVQGERVLLPESFMHYYKGKWEFGNKQYDFDTYFVFNVAYGGEINDFNVRLTANWVGKEYNITYVYLNGSHIEGISFNYGTEKKLNNPVPVYKHTFEGFYEDNNFTTPITKIPADSSSLIETARIKDGLEIGEENRIFIYIKWKELWFMSDGAYYQCTVRGPNWWNYPTYEMDLILVKDDDTSNYEIYNSIKLSIEITIWEKTDCYQKIGLYYTSGDTSSVMWQVQIDHDPSGTNTTQVTYRFEVNIRFDDETLLETGRFEHVYYLAYASVKKEAQTWYHIVEGIVYQLSTEQPNNTLTNTAVYDGTSVTYNCA
ncbi:MAG: InlB B-repeat-containing protein, partial [Clostridia bacterium]|nr:InlB B-repeat-containing protein [Clostridia bacterium]